MTLTGTGGNATVDTNGYTFTLSGTVSGTQAAVSLTKIGLGTLVPQRQQHLHRPHGGERRQACLGRKQRHRHYFGCLRHQAHRCDRRRPRHRDRKQRDVCRQVVLLAPTTDGTSVNSLALTGTFSGVAGTTMIVDLVGTDNISAIAPGIPGRFCPDCAYLRGWRRDPTRPALLRYASIGLNDVPSLIRGTPFRDRYEYE